MVRCYYKVSIFWGDFSNPAGLRKVLPSFGGMFTSVPQVAEVSQATLIRNFPNVNMTISG